MPKLTSAPITDELRKQANEALQLYNEGVLSVEDIIWGWNQTIDMLDSMLKEWDAQRNFMAEMNNFLDDMKKG